MKLTVFTPTYNRAYILHEAYASLCRQDCKDFEWLIIDDGSSDNTGELVNSWISNDNGFPIRYERVPNGGKMKAMNRAFREANGELFIVLDSDDSFTDDAISTICHWESSISHRRNEFAGVAGLKCHKDGRPLGKTFDGDYLDCSVADRDKFGIFGDKCEAFYTEILQRHPFKEFPDEKFMAEGILWMEICYEENKVLRWFNSPIYKCDYLEDGYSANANDFIVKNPKGVLYGCIKTIEIKKPKYNEKLHIWHDYYLVGRRNGYSLRRIKTELKLSCFDMGILILGHMLSRVKRKRFEVPA